MAKYDSPAALEMAIKAAAAKSSAETGRAVTSFYFHRLLCRVFSSENTTFVLKGGQEWGQPQEKQYEKMWLQTGLPESLKTVRGAVKLAEALLSPAVKMRLGKMTWNPALLRWEK